MKHVRAGLDELRRRGIRDGRCLDHRKHLIIAFTDASGREVQIKTSRSPGSVDQSAKMLVHAIRRTLGVRS